MVSAQPRVVAVVVTYNRRDVLVECLDAALGQTRPPDTVVVVDNASTDGTPDLLRERYPGVDLLASSRNLGGAGGFALGIRRALGHPCDLTWLLDDDTVPRPGALAALLDVIDRYPGRPPTLVASRVVWTDGRDHPMNTPREKPRVTRRERRAAAAVGCTAVRSASFVSVLVDSAAVRERGLPVADYFLWNDDFEYTTRLLRGRRGLYCPASVVVHKTRRFGGIDDEPGQRFYFEVRNKLWLFTRSRGLAPGERALYAGSTLRRWLRTIVQSADRSTLLRELVRGTRDGLLSAPRPTGLLLAEARTDVLAPAAGAPREPFSLLLAVYGGDRAEYVEAAFVSAVQQQTRPPDEVVVVQDGPVPEELATCLKELVASSPVPAQLVALGHNAGLGPALDAGLAACRYDIIARMDADDVCLPHRFEVQLPIVEAGHDIVGAGLLEFRDRPDEVVGRRTPPTDPKVIRGYARFADPFNHPTVVYRRRAIRAAGGYQSLPLMEDYLLFGRMIAGGARVANVAEPLVAYRVGAGAYSRRGGLALLRSEIALQRRFHRLGVTSRAQLLRNVVVRGGYRLVPEPVRRTAYRALIANYGERHRPATSPPDPPSAPID